MENRETFVDRRNSREANNKCLYTKNLGRYFLTHFNVKTKVRIVVKICIRIRVMAMKGVESSSRAKKKYVGQNDVQSL